MAVAQHAGVPGTDLYAAGGRFDQTADGTERGAFARAVGADQRNDLTLGNVEAYPFDCVDSAVGHAEVPYFQNITHPQHLPDTPR